MLYSGTFARYAMAVTPRNYLLFGCHVVNFTAQSTQMYRWMNYWHFGGRDAKMAAQGALKDVEAKAVEVKDKVVDGVREMTRSK